MQNLHQRLRNEGIVINYPVRTLQFPKEWGPEGVLGTGSSEALRQDNRKYSRYRVARRRPRPGSHIIPDTGGDSGGIGPGVDGPGVG
jgi:hypothetical protein